MTNLANANLLDDDLANGSSLKKLRLSKVAQKASNPIIEEEKIENEEQQKEDFGYEEPRPYSPKEKSFNRDQNYFNESNKSVKNDKSDDEKKILGMNPKLFYGLLAAGIVIGGYLVYTKFIKGKKSLIGSKPIDVLPDANSITVAK